MGIGMATNLQKHLAQTSSANLIYHNRTISRGEPLDQLGASAASSIADVAQKADIIFLSLSDDAALDQVVSALCAEDAGQLSGKIIVDTSTVFPDSTAAAKERVVKQGAQFVAAPVFGASPAAAAGQLLFVLAGPDDALQAIKPFIVGVMGRDTIHLGEDVAKASLLKTAGYVPPSLSKDKTRSLTKDSNFVTVGMMEVVAEAHVFAEKTGLGSEAMEKLLQVQYGPLAYAMSQRLTTGAYIPPAGTRPWSDVQLAVKDVGHGISAASDAGARLHVAELAIAHLKTASAKERPLDSASIYGVLREEAGLDFETDVVKTRDAAAPQ